jgi:AcrR family transcriptional regulator
MMYDRLSYSEVNPLPTATFLNLPAEKRDKFLRAARGEFERVPYTDVSINRIIREAGIPRGSFYMYFKDKRELLLYLLGEYSCRLAELMETALLQQHGDLLAAFLTFFDTVRQEYASPKQEDVFRPLTSILRLNAGLHTQVFEIAAKPEVLLEHLRPHIDKSLLSLRSDTDLKEMFKILTGVTSSSLFCTLQSSDPATARAEYVNRLDILRRGMAFPAKSH